MRLREVSIEGGSTGRMQARLMLALYACVNTALGAMRFLLWPGRLPVDASVICVYRHGNIGDTICALPALEAIRRYYPSAKLILLTSPSRRGLPGAKEVFAGVNWIDEIIEYYPEDIFSPRGAYRFLTMLRSYRFEVFIELPADMAKLRVPLRNMLFVRLLGARWAGGWTITTLAMALQRQSEWIDFPNEVERLLQVVGRCGIPAGRAELSLPLADGHERSAAAILTERGVPEGARLVALCPGAKRAGNRWPADRFAEVGRDLASRGCHLLVMGAGSEWNTAEAIREGIGERCFNIAGLGDIPVAAAMIKRCELVICNDSGLQHVASAVGTPCVAIFSFWQLRGRWWPHHPRSVVLQKVVPCHTCYLRSCPVGDVCVTGTTATEVLSAARGILAEEPRPRCAVGTPDSAGLGLLPGLR